MGEIDFALDKLTMGTDWKSRKRTMEDLKITAYHEAGHAIVAYFTENANPVYKVGGILKKYFGSLASFLILLLLHSFNQVTIVSKGQSGGHTAFLPKEMDHMTRAKTLAALDTGMGGRAAEEIVFGKDKVTGIKAKSL